MSTLKEQLRTNLNLALREKDDLRKATLRLVLGEIQNQEKAGKNGQDFDDAQVQALLQREVKKRRAAAEEYVQAGKASTDIQLARSMRELQEAAIIAAYLPQELDGPEIDKLVADAIAETGATGPRDMGGVMKLVVAAAAGRADGKVISTKVRDALATVARDIA